jgi:hypothetical protein
MKGQLFDAVCAATLPQKWHIAPVCRSLTQTHNSSQTALSLLADLSPLTARCVAFILVNGAVNPFSGLYPELPFDPSGEIFHNAAQILLKYPFLKQVYHSCQSRIRAPFPTPYAGAYSALRRIPTNWPRKNAPFGAGQRFRLLWPRDSLTWAGKKKWPG